MKKVIVLFVLVFFVYMPVFSGGGRQAVQRGPRADIIVALAASNISLDPHETNDQASADVNRQIYSALVRTTAEKMEFTGDLAEHWENISPTVWRFHLRRAVTWHDGEPFTAYDVRHSILRQQTKPQTRHLVSFITDVRILDDHTVDIVTNEPVGPLLANLSHNATLIVPRHVDNLAENPIGTGPMSFVSWTPGVEVKLKRYENYFGGLPFTKTLTYRVISDGQARTIALETGEVDLVLTLDPAGVGRVQSHRALELHEVMSNRIEWLSMNMNRPPFDNVLVRRAIAYAIDVESLNIAVYNGRAQAAASFTGPTVFGFNPRIRAIPHNPARARELLVEAGLPDGFDTVLWSSGEARNRKAELIQLSLQDVGIMVYIKLLEWADYIERTSLGEHYMHLLGWANLSGDADTGLWPIFHTASQGFIGNRSFFSNARVDELLEMGRRETNMAARLPIYHEIQEILYQYLPVIPLHILPIEQGVRRGLLGVEVHPGGSHRLHNLRFE